MMGAEVLFDPNVARAVLANLPLEDCLRARRVCRSWAQAWLAPTVDQVLDYFHRQRRAHEGCIMGMRVAETFDGRPGTIFHLQVRDTRMLYDILASIEQQQRRRKKDPSSSSSYPPPEMLSAEEFAEREQASESKLLRGMAWLARRRSEEFALRRVVFATGWGWTYLFFFQGPHTALPGGGHEDDDDEKFFAEHLRQLLSKQARGFGVLGLYLSEAHLDYDSMFCEDWYEKNSYRSQIKGADKKEKKEEATTSS